MKRSFVWPTRPVLSRVRRLPKNGADEDSGSFERQARYRDRLYDNPESLADVVLVSAVRDGAELRGYRLSPGRAAAEFTALGFRAGDIVTSINGLSLSDPSNTMRLYQTMRDAQAATFELERGGETLSLSVSLDGGSGN